MLSATVANQLKNVKLLERCKSSRGGSYDFWYARLKQSRFSISHLSTCHYRTRILFHEYIFRWGWILRIVTNHVTAHALQQSFVTFYCSLIKPYLTFIFPCSLYLLYFASWQYLLTSFAFLRYGTHGSQDIMNADLQKTQISQSNISCSISKCFCFQNCGTEAFNNDKLLK